MTIELTPKRASRLLAGTIIFLLALNLVGIYLHYQFGLRRSNLFNFGGEQNLPTYYSSIGLLFASILLACIATCIKRRQGRHCLHWGALSLIMLYLSIDDFSMIHEQITAPLRNALHSSGAFYHAWVIPYGILILVVLFTLKNFLFALRPKIRTILSISGIIYVSGGLGMELVGGYWSSSYGEESLFYALITTIEELMEMAGVAVLIYALMTYITVDLNGVAMSLTIHPSNSTDI